MSTTELYAQPFLKYNKPMPEALETAWLGLQTDKVDERSALDTNTQCRTLWNNQWIVSYSSSAFQFDICTRRLEETELQHFIPADKYHVVPALPSQYILAPHINSFIWLSTLDHQTFGCGHGCSRRQILLDIITTTPVSLQPLWNGSTNHSPRKTLLARSGKTLFT